MEESDRVQDLKEAYAKGVIDMDNFEDALSTELNSNRTHMDLNTTIGISDQIWMSEDKENRPDPAKFDTVDGEMHLPIKPTGGMWTSTYTPEDEYDTDWIRWCSTEGFYGGRHKWLMKPKPDLHVLVVDSIEDLRAVTKVYEKDTYKGQDASLISDEVIDFPKIAEDFDAMRLTKEGQRETHITAMDDPDLYGWDTESVLHFRWNWSEYEYLGHSDIETL